MDFTVWMPAGMDPAEKAGWAEYAPDDPHLAAALAWESWAAQQDADPAAGGGAVRSVSTGAQSVTYDGPRTGYGAAMERARWHRARARAYSAEVGPTYGVGPWATDPENGATIAVYDSPAIPPTLPHQINLPPAPGRLR